MEGGTTLADSLLDDLDNLSDGDQPEEEAVVADESQGQWKDDSGDLHLDNVTGKVDNWSRWKKPLSTWKILSRLKES
jgi:hypothetical protein